MKFDTRIKDVFFSRTLAAARAMSPRGFYPEFAEMGRFFVRKVHEGFEQEQDPYGVPWAPLARSTVKDKIARGIVDPERILYETGQLSRSFHYRPLTNGVRLFSDRVFEDGVSAEIHQVGGIHPVGGNNIPARPMLPEVNRFPQDWLAEVDRLVGEGVDRLLGS